MSLDFKHIDEWEAGEIALVTLIAFLLLLLLIMLLCICWYGKIYYDLRANANKPLYQSDGGDGPYNGTVRPNYQPDDSTEEEDDDDTDNDEFDEENNINMANKELRKSFGASSLIHAHGQHRKLMRYNTNNTNQSGSTESDSETNNMSSDTNDEDDEEDEDSNDTQSNLKKNINNNNNHNHNNRYNHNEEDDDEDSDVRNRYKPPSQHAQIRQYNHIGGHQYHPSMPMYQGMLLIGI